MNILYTIATNHYEGANSTQLAILFNICMCLHVYFTKTVSTCIFSIKAVEYMKIDKTN